MKNIFIILIILLSFIKIVKSEDITMKYGGDWVDTTVIQNDDFMSMAGSFVGTNVMQMGSEEIRTKALKMGANIVSYALMGTNEVN